MCDLKEEIALQRINKHLALCRRSSSLVAITLSGPVVKGSIRVNISFQDVVFYFCFSNTVASGDLVTYNKLIKLTLRLMLFCN